MRLSARLKDGIIFFMTEKSFGQSHKTPFSQLERHLKTLAHITKNPDSKTARDVLALQRGLTGKRELAGAGYMNKTNLLDAYISYYFPVSYQQIFYAMQNVRLPESDTVRILDFGSGPGSASAAVIDAVRKKNPQCVIDVVLLDFSQSALNAASAFFRSAYKNIAVRTVRADFERESISAVLKKASIVCDFDLIVSCHLLNELWQSQTDRISRLTALCTDAFSHAAHDGLLILCEPALLKTSRALLSLRDSLCAEGLPLIAPCPSDAPCPALSAGETHTCHADYPCAPIKQLAFLAEKARLERTSVKMTYLVFKKGENPPREISENPRCISGRIVSEAMLNKAGRVRFLLCTGSRRVAISAKKDDPHAAEIGFFALKRLDFVQFSCLEERGDAFGIADETTLKKCRGALIK